MKKAIIPLAIVIVALVFAFFADDIFNKENDEVLETQTPVATQAIKEEVTQTKAPQTPSPEPSFEVTATPTEVPVISTKEPVIPSEVPETPAPTPTVEVTPSPTPEPQNEVIEGEEYTCTIYIECISAIDNLDETEASYVPANGWILGTTEVTFYGGESVFNVLQRVCKENSIHFEFEDVPLYNSAYIEGIYNIYEFDFGPLSGWMYSVNGWFPNYGVSLYTIKPNDSIALRYTCDNGEDIGGKNIYS